MWADPAVTRYIGGKPLTEEEAWTKFLRYAGHWLLLGFGYWAVEERATGCFIGELGFADYKRDIQPTIQGTPEAGWIFSPAVHGKGYAREALREVLAWGDGHFAGGRTVCLIHPENAASIRLAEKCGYKEVRRTIYKDRATIMFSRPPVINYEMDVRSPEPEGVSIFPAELERTAFRSANGEFGWTRAQIPVAVEALLAQGMGILGGELWWVPEGASDWVGPIPQRRDSPAVYVWESRRASDETWQPFIARSAAEALAAVERWPTPGDLPPDLAGRILYNLTWASEAEFKENGTQTM